MMSFPGAGTVLSMQIITVQTDRECFHQTVHKALKFFFITEKSGGPGAPPSSAIESGGHRSVVSAVTAVYVTVRCRISRR